MITHLVKRALAEIRSAFDRNRDPKTLNTLTVREDRPHDMGMLEERVFFSATPLGPMPEPENVQPQEQVDAGQEWQINVDFSDANADVFNPQSGTWEILNERYQGTSDTDAISTLSLNEPLSENLELEITLNMDDVSPGRLSNGFTVFDYQGPTDFKFAGAYSGTDRWVIGHRTDSAWVTDSFHESNIDATTDYHLRLAVAGDSQVTLYVDGNPQVSHAFSDSLSDGLIGVGTREATSRFDDVRLRSLTAVADATPGELPVFEDFEGLQPDHLQPLQGTWVLVDGTYQVTPDPGDVGISTVLLSQPIPDNVEVGVTFNADEFSTSRFSNGFVIFDYQSPTDFKYAGGFQFRDEWVIGQRTSQGFVDDVVLSAPLDAFTDYDIRVVVENGTDVFLYEFDTLLVSHSYNDSVTDGAIGLGSNNSITRFDDFSVIDNTPMSTISAELMNGNLIITGEALGELQIVAFRSDAFEIFDSGQLITTIEGATGDLLVELGEANDQVVVDLGGQSLNGNVVANLGNGNNRFEIKNGEVRQTLTVESGHGADTVSIADNLYVRRHSWFFAGSGNDSLNLAGSFGRMVFFDGGQGNDSLVLSGHISSLSALMGDGDDRVELRSQAEIGVFAFFSLGAGDDTFVDETENQAVYVFDE